MERRLKKGLASMASSLTDIAATSAAASVGMFVIRTAADAIDEWLYLQSGVAAFRNLNGAQPQNCSGALPAVKLLHDVALATANAKTAAEKALNFVLRGLYSIVLQDVVEIGLIGNVPLEVILALLLCLPKLSFKPVLDIVKCAIFHYMKHLHIFKKAPSP